LAAEEEVEAVMKEINGILEGTPYRAEAERILLKTHADRVDEAADRARILLDRWLAHVRDWAGRP